MKSSKTAYTMGGQVYYTDAPAIYKKLVKKMRTINRNSREFQELNRTKQIVENSMERYRVPFKKVAFKTP